MRAVSPHVHGTTSDFTGLAGKQSWRARQDSNLWPSAPEATSARARRARRSCTSSGGNSGPPETTIVKVHHVFNDKQAEGLKLRSLAEAAPEWEGHERAEALIHRRGVRLDHVVGDRAYYSLKDDVSCCPTRASSSRSRPTRTRGRELRHPTRAPGPPEPADPGEARRRGLGGPRA